MNLHFSKLNQEITKESRMFSLSLCPQVTQQWREWRHHCCLTAPNPTKATCVPIKGQGHASILDLLQAAQKLRPSDRSVQ